MQCHGVCLKNISERYIEKLKMHYVKCENVSTKYCSTAKLWLRRWNFEKEKTSIFYFGWRCENSSCYSQKLFNILPHLVKNQNKHIFTDM